MKLSKAKEKKIRYEMKRGLKRGPLNAKQISIAINDAIKAMKRPIPKSL